MASGVPEAIVPSAMDTLPISLAVLDDEGTILRTNRAWREFGVANDVSGRPDMVGVNYLEVTERAESESARTVATGLSELLAGDREVLEVEYPCHSPEERRWFLMRAATFELGTERYVAVAHLDVTERVESERELAKFRRAIETAGHAIFTCDTDGEITYVNPAFERITGYDAREAVGRTPRLLKSGETDDALYEDLWTTVLGGEVWEGRVVNRRKSGELYHARETVAPVLEDGEPVEFVAIQTDVTDATEAKNRIEKLEHLLRHDLRNQLNVARGYADLIRKDDAAATEYATVISGTLTRLLGTVEKARQLQAFLSSSTTTRARNVAGVVRDVVATQRATFPDATVTVEAPGTATALAPDELEIAVGELLENAVVHGGSDAPRVAVTVAIHEEWVDVQVADDGPGIPEMEYDSLGSDTDSELHHDSGLGLNLVYWIVRRSGGQLLFEDDEPRGALVTIRLPRTGGCAGSRN